MPTGDGCYFIFNPCVNANFLKVAYSFFLDKRLAVQAKELINMLKVQNYDPCLDDLGKVTDKHKNSREILWLHALPPLAEVDF